MLVVDIVIRHSMIQHPLLLAEIFNARKMIFTLKTAGSQVDTDPEVIRLWLYPAALSSDVGRAMYRSV